MVARRDDEAHKKQKMSRDEFANNAVSILEDIHSSLYKKAYGFMEKRLKKVDSLEEFESFFSDKNKDNGFAYAHWNEEAIGHSVFQKLKVSPRCIPLQEGGLSGSFEKGTCIFSGKPSQQRVVFAKSY